LSDKNKQITKLASLCDDEEYGNRKNSCASYTVRKRLLLRFELDYVATTARFVFIRLFRSELKKKKILSNDVVVGRAFMQLPPTPPFRCKRVMTRETQ
jgi:hypothetical protein